MYPQVKKSMVVPSAGSKTRHNSAIKKLAPAAHKLITAAFIRWLTKTAIAYGHRNSQYKLNIGIR
jgi:hypothetical protein